ncbi:hypothetical protein [Streptomyces sp. NPDC059411]|uniref:hypothetical protein n=1 Tax=Streptomyces sp. NPDC059411 TaxID=3346825 RepID=UPI0036845CA8
MAISKISSEAAPGFPRDAFDRVQVAVRTTQAGAHPLAASLRTEITAASLAVVYRHRQAWESGEGLLELAQQQRSERGTDWHFAAQTAVFGFYVSLLSSFESTFYALYFAGAQLSPEEFPFIKDDKTHRSIGPASAAKAFTQAWPDDRLSLKLAEVSSSYIHKDSHLAKTRNILAHRVAPGFEHRVMLLGEDLADAKEVNYELAWGGRPVEQLIPETLAEAESVLGSLWEAAADFLDRRAI